MLSCTYSKKEEEEQDQVKKRKFSPDGEAPQSFWDWVAKANEKMDENRPLFRSNERLTFEQAARRNGY